MPKYIPTNEDLYNTNPCFICGQDCIDDDSDTCSPMCKLQKEIADEDWEYFLWKDYEEEDYEDCHIC